MSAREAAPSTRFSTLISLRSTVGFVDFSSVIVFSGPRLALFSFFLAISRTSSRVKAERRAVLAALATVQARRRGAGAVIVSVVFETGRFLARDLMLEVGDIFFTGLDWLTVESAFFAGFLTGFGAAFLAIVLFFGAGLAVVFFAGVFLVAFPEAFFTTVFLATFPAAALRTGAFLADLGLLVGVFFPVVVFFFTVFFADALPAVFLMALPEVTFLCVAFLGFD